MSATWAAFSIIFLLIVMALGAGFLYHESHQLHLELDAASHVQTTLATENLQLRAEKDALQQKIDGLENSISQRDGQVAGLQNELNACQVALDLSQKELVVRTQTQPALIPQTAQMAAAKTAPAAPTIVQQESLAILPPVSSSAALLYAIDFTSWPALFGFGAVLFTTSSVYALASKKDRNVSVRMTRGEAVAFSQWKRKQPN